MDVIDESTEDLKQVVDFLTALLLEGRRLANRTAAFLATVPAFAEATNNPPSLSPAFLLEVAAVLRLQDWERAGLTQWVPEVLPTARDMARQLMARLEAAPDSFGLDEELAASALFTQLGSVWIRHFSWDAPRILGVDIVVREDSNDLLEELADLIWQHRHLMQDSLAVTPPSM